MDITEFKKNWNSIEESVKNAAIDCKRNPEEVQIVAVSKTHPSELIEVALESGIKIFGENYAQEFISKAQALTSYNLQPEWHFIGHLQTNKVKYVIPYVKMIHSVDSLHLAEEISKQAKKHNKTIEILLQVNTSGEESKFGCDPELIYEFAEKVQYLENLNVTGLMTIGTFSENPDISRKEFSILRNIRENLNKKFNTEKFVNLSMGMSNDYAIAIQEGSTYIRIGTSIFGYRKYTK
jgi:pyridoxal phosphate enzyme (YggS family)